MLITDQLGRKVTLENTPKRIVCLVPSMTELLVDLGLEKNIVGVTKFCVHPDHIRKDKTIVGGTKTVHIHKIYALNPDIILCNKEENTREIVEQCKEIAPVHISDIKNIEDTLQLIKQYGEIFECEKKAEEIIHSIRKKNHDFQIATKNFPIFKVAYFIWRKPWMVAGNNTFINYLLRINKYENVLKNQERYPEVTLEDLKKKDFDFIFLSSEPYPFKEEHLNELQELFPNQQIVLVDGEYFSWYGTRLDKAFNYFLKLRKSLN